MFALGCLAVGSASGRMPFGHRAFVLRIGPLFGVPPVPASIAFARRNAVRLVFILLTAAGFAQLAAGFCFVAAFLASSGSAWADTVGYSGLAISALGAVASSIYIWRTA